MNKIKKPKQVAKGNLHKRNLHRDRYDLDTLCQIVPELSKHQLLNIRGQKTIDFSNPRAVLLLNKALLIHYYDLKDWFIPHGYLCPPIPGRTDYIHYASDLLASSNFGRMPKARVLDIGTGANLIYPITGTFLYHWSFVGSDIDPKALLNGKELIHLNKRLQGQIELRRQKNPNQLLSGIINRDDRFDLIMCNPPFFKSAEEAMGETKKKYQNLKKEKTASVEMNFQGKNNELWCPGGEKRFISQLVNESKNFRKQCFWFSTLVSKASHLQSIKNSLEFHKAEDINVIEMSQGNKASRIIAWTFLNKKQKTDWQKTNWSNP